MDQTSLSSMDKKMQNSSEVTSALCSFVKTPCLSPVKTRLAHDIGKTLAHKFYELSIDATEEVISKVETDSHKKIKPYWSIAEEKGLCNSRWQTLARFWQQEGLLGDRLNQSFSYLKKSHNKVVMIGADSPHLSADIFIKANQLLDHHPCVIGPSIDGGFYLFASKLEIPQPIWTSVRYSTSYTLNDLTKYLKGYNIPVKLLDLQEDVDNLQDLQYVFNFLKKSDTLLPKQKVLYKWLKYNL
jgi:uncharacterized protein